MACCKMKNKINVNSRISKNSSEKVNKSDNIFFYIFRYIIYLMIYIIISPILVISVSIFSLYILFKILFLNDNKIDFDSAINIFNKKDNGDKLDNLTVLSNK